ncbi:MAG: porin [Limisphaerales bacterium]
MNKSIQLGMATFIAGAGVAMGQTTQEQIDALEEQILKLQQQVENGGAQPNFLNQAAAQGLQFNFYGQITWQSGGGTTKADAYRYVLIPTYKLSDYAKFVSEFELEHGGLKDGDNDRFSGALELEQMYIDVNVNEYVNWRSLGVSLIPIGEINQYHEPDQFYSSKRPQLYKSIIPTTWMELGTGFNGDTPIDGLKYEYYLSQGLHPYGAAGTDTSWTPKSARPDLNNKNIEEYAHTIKFSYQTGGLYTSASAYMQEYTNSNDASTDVLLYNLHAKYEFENGLRLLAEYAAWDFDNPSNLTDNASDTVVNDEYAGYRLEISYDIAHGDNTLTPFLRYEELDDDITSTQETDKYTTFGAMYKFGDNWEVKANVERKDDGGTGTETDTIQLSVGMQF